MKLRGEDPPPLQRRGKPHPVLAPADAEGLGAEAGLNRDGRSGVRSPGPLRQATLGLTRARGPRYNRIVRVDEVEVSARGDAVEQAEALVLDAVPAHVGHLAARRKAPD